MKPSNINSVESTKRIKTFAPTAKSVAESRIFGESWYGTNKFTILRMVIDDGVPSRENRKNIFSSTFTMNAILSVEGLTVIDFA